MTTLNKQTQQYLESSLQAYLPEDRDKGRHYYDAGLATINTFTADTITGIVRTSTDYRVKLLYAYHNTWISQCSCPKRSQCSHVYALGLTALRQPSWSTKPVDPLESKTSAILGREITPQERAYIKRIKSAWSKYEKDEIVTEDTLSLLNNQDVYHRDWHHTNKLEGYWTTPPKNEIELLGYATVYQERNQIRIHPLAVSLIDLKDYQNRASQSLKKTDVLNWKKTLRAKSIPATPEPSTSQTIDIVMVLNKSRWTFKSRNIEGNYSPLNSDQIDRLMHEGLNTLSEQGIAFLIGNLDFFEGWTGTITSPKSKHARKLLYNLLTHPQLRKSVVDRDNNLIPFQKDRVYWKTTKIKNGGDEIAQLELILPDGSPLPSNTISLQSDESSEDEQNEGDEFDDYEDDEFEDELIHTQTPDLYLIDNTIYRGASLLGEKSKIELPWQSLASEEGITFLNSQLSPVPLELSSKVQKVTPQLQLSCNHDVPDTGTSSAFCKLQAFSSKSTPLYHFTSRGWQATHQIDNTGGDDRIQIIDQDTLILPPNLFTSSELSWHNDDKAWEHALNTASDHDAFTNWIQNLPQHIEVQLSPELSGMEGPAVDISYEIDTQESDSLDWFDIKLVRKVKDAHLTEEEIELLLAAPGKLVKLPSGQWRRANLKQSAETQRITKDLGLNDPQDTQRLHALQLDNEQTIASLSETAKAQIANRISNLQTLPQETPPKEFEKILRPYQVEGFQYLCFLSNAGLGGILADDMGLGKTLQALLWLSWLKTKTDKQASFRALIICPKSVMDNWTHESEKFETKLSAVCYNPRSHEALPDINLLVSNYTQLRLHEEVFQSQLWDAVILDEGQYIKSPSSQTARAACNLRTDRRLILTGTPIENRALDLWSLMRFAMPGLLGSQSAFRRTFSDKDPLSLPRLARRIKPFVLRRTKGQVAQDLPERIEEEIHCELEGEQAKLYKAELKKAQQGLLDIKNKKQFDEGRFNILQSLMRLRQICCDPQLLGTQVKEDFVSAKVQGLLDIIEPLQEEGHKILIFSQFVSMLELLEKTLDSKSIPYLTLTGKTQNRKALIDRFQESDSEKVFLLSLKAAGSGLNLTAASYVAIFDPWWNPAVEAQAIDRTHRIGQTRQVIAYRLIAKNTIEEKIRELQKQKSNLANAIIDEDALSNVLTLDDIRFILADPA